MLSTPNPRRTELERAVRWACEMDVRAVKPGNVGLHGAGHGMAAEDFLASARAIAAPITVPGQRVGLRVLRCIQATRRVVRCNTNLGIVLALAPLTHAALGMPAGSSLRAQTRRTLKDLDTEDARHAYRAIRLARPGGLGSARQHDVAQEPQVGLLEAMIEAARRDGIARLYASAYQDLFEVSVPLARGLLARWGSETWTTTAVYLDILRRDPDTLIARKQGERAACKVSAEASVLHDDLVALDSPARLAPRLLEWDARLKAEGLNPGTSADLTVATLFALRAEAILAKEFTAAPPMPAGRVRRGGFEPTVSATP